MDSVSFEEGLRRGRGGVGTTFSKPPLHHIVQERRGQSGGGAKWAELELGALPWTESQSPKPPQPPLRERSSDYVP